MTKCADTPWSKEEEQHLVVFLSELATKQGVSNGWPSLTPTQFWRNTGAILSEKHGTLRSGLLLST